MINKYARMVVEFFGSGQAEGLAPGETPLAALAQNQIAADAGLTAENMTKIAQELAAL